MSGRLWRCSRYSSFTAPRFDSISAAIQSSSEQRFVDAGSDAAVRLLGVAVGACLAPLMHRRRHPSPWLALLWVACVVSAAISTWSPFQVLEQRQAFAWFPLLGSYSNNWFPAASHLIELGLIYFPFGFVLALVYRGRSVVMVALVLSFAGAVGISRASRGS